MNGKGRLGYFHTTAFDRSDIENIVDNRQQLLCCTEAIFQVMLEIPTMLPRPAHKSQIADNRIERCPYFMAHLRQEIPFGLAGLPSRIKSIQDDPLAT